MKIIKIVLGKANPQRPNGVNKVVHSLSCWFQKHGIDIEVWGITRDPDAQTPDRPYKLRLFRTGSLLFMPSDELSLALQKLSQNTIVHFHGVLIPVFSNIASRLRRMGIPYIVTPHSALSPQALKRRSLRKKLYITFIEKKFIFKAAAIQALTHAEASDITKIFPEAKIIIVPNGVDLPDGTDTGIGKPDMIKFPLFGFIGRIERYQKGLDLLLDGFRTYKNNNGTGRLVIVGKGPDMDWMENRISTLGIDRHIIVTGALFKTDLEKTMSRITTVVYPSRWEGLAMAILESFAMGIPAIVSKATNLSGAVTSHKAGWALADNNAADIAQAMMLAQLALEDGSLQSYSLSTKNLAETQFSWDFAGHKMITDIYEKIS